MTFKYPTAAEILADIANETTAINVAIAAIEDALDGCPLSDILKVYALCEAACKYVSVSYAEEVVNEIRVLRDAGL